MDQNGTLRTSIQFIMRVILALVCLSFLVTPSTSFKILVYNSKFGQSNGHFMGTIADILVEAGHNVTSLIPIIEPSFNDNTEKSHKIYIDQTEKTKQITEFLNSDATNWFEMDTFDFIKQFLVGTPYSDRFALQCEGVLKEEQLIERLRNEEYDVFIAENFDMCGIGLVPLIKPRALINTAASSPIAWMSDEFGLPSALSYNPSPTISHVDIHSMWSRLNNIISELMYYRFFASSRWMIEDLFREKFGPDYPSLKGISSHAAYTLIYSEPLIDYASPTLNRVVYVGGIGARPAKELDEHFDRLLVLRTRTVLISFGTVVMTHRIPENVKRSIVQAVSRFPDVTFIWKYENPEDAFAKETASVASNLHLAKWIPQNDILSDTRLSAFITHGGAASTQEFMLKGKPGLSIPIFTDQPRNAGLLDKNGLGKMFDKFDLVDTDKFAAAIKDLLENENYRENARKLAAKLAKKPFSSKEQLIRTVEFAAEFGGSPALRPQSYDMAFMEYHNLDIIVFLVIMFAALLVASARLAMLLLRSLVISNLKWK
ncbi:hypothetical protein PENTCL1PPCAC_21442 [Pristionchus entomophagus]|uniref:glucuronosyltransferase n=1 Tax=Pristionchus entomophagus TaxID=358040 RepID=A0AAV5TY30_9BILA|nr:hypothetical protein PENTCL1PPCAC_21442 [Pristionchus entomophagus]